MRVRDLMQTSVVTLELADRLDLADDLMNLARIRHMPVVSCGTLVGLISQRDLFRAGISSVLQLRHKDERDWLRTIRVEDVMTPDVHTIGPDQSARDAVELMLNERIGCLPVVEGDKLIGLLSETDCLRYLSRLLGIAEEKQALPELPGAT